MGKPKAERRLTVIKVPVTEGELAVIKEQARAANRGGQVAPYIREVILSLGAADRDERRLEVAVALIRIAADLGKIGRWAVRTHSVATAARLLLRLRQVALAAREVAGHKRPSNVMDAEFEESPHP